MIKVSLYFTIIILHWKNTSKNTNVDKRSANLTPSFKNLENNTLCRETNDRVVRLSTLQQQ